MSRFAGAVVFEPNRVYTTGEVAERLKVSPACFCRLQNSVEAPSKERR